MSWTYENAIRAKSMWDEGKNASEIARELGTTRKSVQGKLRRMERGRRDSIAWEGERKTKLLEMTEAGYSARRIAEEFGDCTRNAVIGVWFRLGIKRPKPTVTVKPRKPRHRPVRREKFKFQIVKDPTPLREVPMAPNCNPVALVDLKPHHCRYIPDDPAGERTMYCGAPVVEDKSWCPYHHEIVTIQVAPSRQPFIPMRKAA